MIAVGKQIEKVFAQKPTLSLSTLAKRARIGEVRLVKIVHQNAPPSMAELERLADALGVSPSFLVEEEDGNSDETPLDPELVKLLRDPMLAASLWGLAQLPLEDRKAIARIIEAFAER